MSRSISLIVVLCGALAWRVTGPPEVEWSGPVVAERALARRLPDQRRTRVTVRAAVTGNNRTAPTLQGALAIDRPGRMRLDLYAPMGADPAFTLSISGRALYVDLGDGAGPRVADRAQDVLEELTDGLAGIDDVVGLLLGDLPLDDASRRQAGRVEEGDTWLRMAGSAGTHVDALLDRRTASPRRLVLRDRSGRVLVRIRYGQFVEESSGLHLPGALVAEVPKLGLVAELDFGSWEPHSLASSVFELDH